MELEIVEAKRNNSDQKKNRETWDELVQSPIKTHVIAYPEKDIYITGPNCPMMPASSARAARIGEREEIEKKKRIWRTFKFARYKSKNVVSMANMLDGDKNL